MPAHPVMSTSPLQLSIIVPTFNEVANIDEVVRRVADALEGTSWEMVFVDDDSPDGTARRVRELALVDPRIRCIQRVGRRGLSTACIEGMLAASAPVLAVMDADLQHDERILPNMLNRILEGNDVVIGTRYAQGGGTGEWDDKRKQMSMLATRISHLVLKQPVSDPMSGFFMLKRDVLEACVRDLSGMGFKILLDLLATHKHKLNLAEVPYQFRTRIHGESKLDHMVIWEYGMLLADKLVGKWIPVRFLAFSVIGGIGVFVHMVVLTLALKGAGLDFSSAQTGATVLTMVFNFILNNSVTYRDQRLKGAAWLRGLVSFMLACSVGAVANIGIATYLFEHRTSWLPAALAGILVGAVWNFAITKIYTWGKK